MPIQQRIFKLSTGNSLYLTKNPPFDFWTINYGRGGLPSHLRGNFTSFSFAYRAIEGYLADKGITIDEEEPWLDQPEM